MGEITLGTITSRPNERGEHSLVCPNCSQSFLSTISRENKTESPNNVSCPACKYSDESQHFIAAAHKHEVQKMATAHVQKEINKALGGKDININLRL